MSYIYTYVMSHVNDSCHISMTNERERERERERETQKEREREKYRKSQRERARERERERKRERADEFMPKIYQARPIPTSEHFLQYTTNMYRLCSIHLRFSN